MARFHETMQTLGEHVLDPFDGLPPTTFRCTCGRWVLSYEPAGDGRSFDIRHRGDRLQHPECKARGLLENFSLADWLAEWQRRGRPAHLTWRLRPLVSAVGVGKRSGRVAVRVGDRANDTAFAGIPPLF
jgi:hypothetical protein